MFASTEMFYVSPGDVLGWIPANAPNHGDIGYYSINSDVTYREYQYDMTFYTYVGAIFSRQLGTAGLAKAINVMHMLRAYVHNPVVFRRNYSGIYFR